MSKEEKLEKISSMKKYFFVSFLVSFLFLLVSFGFCMLLHDWYLNIATKLFGITPLVYNRIMVLLFGVWKILIIQFTLIPTIALWIIEQKCSNKSH